MKPKQPTSSSLYLSLRTLISSTLLFAIFLFTGCATHPAIIETIKDAPMGEEDISLPTIPSQKVNIAFAGGGWRAHTGHSAWTIALLDHGQNKLDDVFSNVETISSNSGGSWFSAMLLFSNDFVTDIEAKDAVSTWTTTGGWTGKQRADFASVSGCFEMPRLECVFDHYTHKDIDGGEYWKLVVENLIFKDYPLNGAKLSHPHQPWALNKRLLMASSLLTNEVVLNLEDDLGYVYYYQACLSPSTPIMGSDRSTCSNGQQVDVTPVTFSSIPAVLGFQPSPFFAELNAITRSNKFQLGYRGDYSDSDTESAEVQNPLNYDQVDVTTAAAASSAAVGFGASKHLTGNFVASSAFDDDAITFSLENSNVQYINAEDLELSDLATKKVISLADGGAVDNSGVAQLVRSLQLNGQTTGFNIVAFDNVDSITVPTLSGQTGAKVGIDIASLFGYADPLCIDVKGYKFCVNPPSLKIFDSVVLYTTSHNWNYVKGGNQLVYTKYKVTTIDNPALGVSAGSTGILHSFTCSYPSAKTEPADPANDFNTYHEMFKFINEGLTSGANRGLNSLRLVLGI